MDPEQEEFFNALMIVVAVVGVVLIYFIITIIRYQRRSMRLHKEKIQAEIDTLENERKRIAADLHDELGPLLSAVKLQINNLDTTHPEDKALITKSSTHIDSIIKKLREISNNLLPNTLVRKGLQRAIEEFTENTQEAHKVQIKFICEQPLQLEQQMEINLYRVVQEIVHNTVKHAKADWLIIKLSIDNDRLFLMTSDNGVGFDFFSNSRDNSGLGLRNLQSRAEVMGGELSCSSESGKGTTYTIEIPLKNTR
jgi:two-component system, NarL family, sensor kinase